MLKTTGIFLTGFLVLLVACARETTLKESSTFQDDIEFLQRYEEVLLLQDATGDKQVAVVPAWQGRVMTSTNSGPEGPSFGWINRDLIQTGVTLPHINPYGGEDRFWMGPEGGQFAIFFKPGDPFDLEHWQTPAIVDTDRWSTTSSSTTSASFREEVSLTNYSGTNFNLRIDRTVRLLGAAKVSQLLGTAAPSGVHVVGFASENQITNIGETAWKKETGLLSIWILGMYVPSVTTTVIIPFRQGPEKELGPIVNDSYFGKVPVDRLRVKGSAVYFTADGKYRSKIGLNPYRAAGIAGSFDSSRDLLTVIQYNQPEGLAEYVNSMWEIQEQPYAGDVINSYNDGPPEPGKKPMGPFYELETSSPAAALKPGNSISHVHRTYHFTGPSRQLDGIAREVLGVALTDIPD